MSIEAMKLALETLEQIQEGCNNVIADKRNAKIAVDLAKLVRKDCNKPIDAIRKALAQPDQEPVAWMREDEDCSDCIVWEQTEEHTIPLYTAPPQRKPLTDEQCIYQMLNSGFERNSLGWSFPYGRLDYYLLKFAKAIEAAHGIKGE